jgi:N-acyl-D-aspartate/D-glutamate deacylase
VVNGQLVLADGEHTGSTPGRALRLRSGPQGSDSSRP